MPATGPRATTDTVRLDQEFGLPVPADRAFAVLTDAREIADAVPGATLTGWDGTTFDATVKLRLGLLPVTGHGTGRMVFRDRAARRALVEVRSRRGVRVADIAVEVRPDGPHSRVRLRADVLVPAGAGRLGRSMVTEVGNRMFASSSAALVARLEGEPAPVEVHDDGSFVLQLPKKVLPAVTGAMELAVGVALAVARRVLGGGPAGAGGSPADRSPADRSPAQRPPSDGPAGDRSSDDGSRRGW